MLGIIDGATEDNHFFFALLAPCPLSHPPPPVPVSPFQCDFFAAGGGWVGIHLVFVWARVPLAPLYPRTTITSVQVLAPVEFPRVPAVNPVSVVIQWWYRYY